jgi:hypothetical protein
MIELVRAPPRVCHSDGETLPAFGATASDHLTPGSGGHARTKTVGTLTTNFARLVGTLHAGISIRASVRKIALKQVHAGRT